MWKNKRNEKHPTKILVKEKKFFFFLNQPTSSQTQEKDAQKRGFHVVLHFFSDRQTLDFCEGLVTLRFI